MGKEENFTDDELRKLIFKKNGNVEFKVQKGIVTIIRKQNHPIQKFFRKLHFTIPQQTCLDLDQYGSFVFQQIDGKHSTYEIGQMLGHKFPDTEEYLYSRLLLYLQHIERNEKLIERVSQKEV